MSRWKRAPATPTLGDKPRPTYMRGQDPSSSPWPGRYEQQVKDLMESTGAGAVLLLVLDGNKGSGFQFAHDATRPYSNADVPALLRRMADMMAMERGQS